MTKKKGPTIKATESERESLSHNVYSRSQTVAHLAEVGRSSKSLPTSYIAATSGNPSTTLVSDPPTTATTRFKEPEPIRPNEKVETKAESKSTKKKKAQQAKLLQDFFPHFPMIRESLFGQYWNSYVGEACECGNGTRNVQCNDCLCYKTSCKDCFIRQHRNNPLHWAQVWDNQQGHFVRHDISALNVPGCAIQLGHHGGKCPRPSSDAPLTFIISHTNGIHGTHIQFCACGGLVDLNKALQLLDSRLFPATMLDPQSAFSFNLLREHHIHHLQSKCSAYDYYSALQRLTDNVFTSRVPDGYKAFRRVTRLWDFFVMEKQTGQAHEIDRHFPFRPAGSLVVRCPACPERGVNMEKNWGKAPYCLRHLHQIRLTNDGNYHDGQYMKNTDPDDVSLSGGRAYMPPDGPYVDYLSKVPTTPEKSVCNYIKAVNLQNTKKFKYMRISGTSQVQCDHVFVLSCVDLQLGERFANVDYAVGRALMLSLPYGERMKIRLPNDVLPPTPNEEDRHPDVVLSADFACSYCVHIKDRFRKYFPELLDIVERMRFCIPMLHIQNHQEKCMYCYCASYLECMPHFHGESAEQEHPELNKLGGQVKQMNHGHRHDKLNNFHGDWNWKKTISMTNTLQRDLFDARLQFKDKRDHLLGLSQLYEDRVLGWRKAPRTTTMVNGSVQSVYCHKPSVKLPSLQKIYNSRVGSAGIKAAAKKGKRVAEEDDLEDNNALNLPPPSSSLAASVASTAIWLKEAMAIQEFQITVKGLRRRETEHHLASQAKELQSRCVKLSQRLSKHFKGRSKIMPSTVDYRKPDKPQNVEDTILYLPSDFTATERLELQLEGIAGEERLMREGELVDALVVVREASLTLSCMRTIKKKDARGQRENMRSESKCVEQEHLLDSKITHYNNARAQLLKLTDEDARFPPLSIADTYRKSTYTRRQLGDSRRPDGKVWAIGAPTLASLSKLDNDDESDIETEHDDSDSDSDNTDNHEMQVENMENASQNFRSSSDCQFASTKMTTRRSKQHTKSRKRPDRGESSLGEQKAKEGFEGNSLPEEDGWIWNIKPGKGMTEAEVTAWQAESDSVQWYRADAEMFNWLHQLESKHAEFERTISFFFEMNRIWLLLSTSTTNGRAAFAKKQASMWYQMAHESLAGYEKVGVKSLRNREGTDHTLADRVLQFRRRELDGLGIHDL